MSIEQGGAKEFKKSARTEPKKELDDAVDNFFDTYLIYCYPKYTI